MRQGKLQMAARVARRILPLVVIIITWWMVRHGRYLEGIVFVGLLIFIALDQIADSLRGGFIYGTKEVADELDRSEHDQ